jgi:hypothetical protein
MDEAFPFFLPPEPELLVLAFAADRAEVFGEFRTACVRGQRHLASRLAAVFGLTIEDVRSDSNYILRVACACGRLELVRWLAGRFGLTVEDAREDKNFALRSACVNGHLELAGWLADYFGLTVEDARADQNHALRTVSSAGHLKVARWLAVRFGLTAEDARTGDNDALHHASVHGHLGSMHWLVSHHGLTAEDVRNSEILYTISARPGQMRWLAARFASTTADTPADRSLALRLACRHGHLAAVRRQVRDSGPAARVRDLRAACAAGHFGVAVWLAANSTQTPAGVRAGNGRALDSARKKGRRAIVRWLEGFAGRPASSF